MSVANASNRDVKLNRKNSPLQRKLSEVASTKDVMTTPIISHQLPAIVIVEQPAEYIKDNTVEEAGVLLEDVIWESEPHMSSVQIELAAHYVRCCKENQTVPISSVIKSLNAECTEFVLRYRRIGELGSKTIGRALEVNNFITYLDLSCNGLGDEGARQLLKSLELNQSIKSLNLSNNSLRRIGLEIASLLSVNSTITSLLLARNNLGDLEVTQVGATLGHNRVLKMLDLSYNKIGDLGAIALGKAISTLQELDLSWNEIRGRGLSGFMDTCRDSPSLTYLNLAHNGIVGCNNLIPFLTKTHIQKLNLSSMRFDDPTFVALAKGLESNRSLVALEISGINQGSASFKGFFKALSNTKITALTMRDVRLEKEDAAYLDTLRSPNLLIEE